MILWNVISKGARGETNGHLELLGVQDIKMVPWTKEVAVVEMRTTDGYKRDSKHEIGRTPWTWKSGGRNIGLKAMTKTRLPGFQIGISYSLRENTDRTLGWRNGVGGVVLWDWLWTYWFGDASEILGISGPTSRWFNESSIQRSSQDRSSLEISVHESSGFRE